MKVALSVKNTSKVVNPIRDDVIIYDGKEWYVTTKAKILEDDQKLLAECRAELQNCRDALAQSEQKFAEFKLEVGEQLKLMSDLIERLFTQRGEKL